MGLGGLRHRPDGEIAVSGGYAVSPPWMASRWQLRSGEGESQYAYLAIFMALLRTPDKYGGLYPDQWVMLLAVVVTVMSGYGYFARFARVLRAARARA